MCLTFFTTPLKRTDEFGRSLRNAVKFMQCVLPRERIVSDVTLYLWCQPCPVCCVSDGCRQTRAEWGDLLSRQSHSVSSTTEEWVRIQSVWRLTVSSWIGEIKVWTCLQSLQLGEERYLKGMLSRRWECVWLCFVLLYLWGLKTGSSLYLWGLTALWGPKCWT